MEMFCNLHSHSGSHLPHTAVENSKCGWCNWEIEFFIIISLHLNIKIHICLADTLLGRRSLQKFLLESTVIDAVVVLNSVLTFRS